MADRLTRWEGQNPDGSPRAVLVKREGPFAEIFQPALAKLAELEDMEGQGDLQPVVYCRNCKFFKEYKPGERFCCAEGGMDGRVRGNDYCSTGRRRGDDFYT